MKELLTTRQDAVNGSFKAHLSITKLEAKHLPSFPYQIDRVSDAWPRDATGVPLTRFDWKQNHDHQTNQSGITDVFNHVKYNGPTLFPGSAGALCKIFDDHLKEKIVDRFKYMAKQFCGLQKKGDARRDAETEERETENGSETEPVEGGDSSRSKKNARVKGVRLKSTNTIMEYT